MAEVDEPQSVATIAATSVDLLSRTLTELGNDAPESMAIIAVTSADASFQAAIDAQLNLLAEDDVPETVAMMAATSVDLRSCALPELGDDTAESMATMAANSAEAFLHAAMDVRLHPGTVGDVSASIVMMDELG